MELEDCIIQKDVARFSIYVWSGDTLLVSHFTESYKINNYKISKHGFLSIMRRFENKRDSLPVSFCGGYAGRGIGVKVTLVLDSGKQYTYSYCKKYWDGLRFVVTQLKANAKVK